MSVTGVREHTADPEQGTLEQRLAQLSRWVRNVEGELRDRAEEEIQRLGRMLGGTVRWAGSDAAFARGMAWVEAEFSLVEARLRAEAAQTRDEFLAALLGEWRAVRRMREELTNRIARADPEDREQAEARRFEVSRQERLLATALARIADLTPDSWPAFRHEIHRALDGHGGGITTGSEPVTAPLRREHRELSFELDGLRALARDLPRLLATELNDRLGAALSFLETRLLPHARAEDAVLYGEIERLAGTPGSTATMRADHAGISDLVTELHSLAARIEGVGAEDDQRAEAQRLLYALDAIVRLHLHKEELVYFPLLDEKVSAARASGLFEQMSAAAHQT